MKLYITTNKKSTDPSTNYTPFYVRFIACPILQAVSAIVGPSGSAELCRAIQADSIIALQVIAVGFCTSLQCGGGGGMVRPCRDCGRSVVTGRSRRGPRPVPDLPLLPSLPVPAAGCLPSTVPISHKGSGTLRSVPRSSHCSMLRQPRFAVHQKD